jgi:putative oxidoreductase
MAIQSDTPDLVTASPPAFAATDGFAMRAGDVLALVCRLLIGWLFLVNGWAKLMNIAGFVGYLTNLKVPAPGAMAWVAAASEFLIGAALILGIATRYAALYTFVYLVIATALAHRYWEYPAAQQLNQYNHFLKNVAIMGGAALLFVTGAGRYAVDALMRRR